MHNSVIRRVENVLERFEGKKSKKVVQKPKKVGKLYKLKIHDFLNFDDVGESGQYARSTCRVTTWLVFL